MLVCICGLAVSGQSFPGSTALCCTITSTVVWAVPQARYHSAGTWRSICRSKSPKGPNFPPQVARCVSSARKASDQSVPSSLPRPLRFLNFMPWPWYHTPPCSFRAHQGNHGAGRPLPQPGAHRPQPVPDRDDARVSSSTHSMPTMRFLGHSRWVYPLAEALEAARPGRLLLLTDRRPPWAFQEAGKATVKQSARSLRWELDGS